MKNNYLNYEEPRLDWYEVSVEAGFSASDVVDGWGDTGAPGDDFGNNDYGDEL